MGTQMAVDASGSQQRSRRNGSELGFRAETCRPRCVTDLECNLARQIRKSARSDDTINEHGLPRFQMVSALRSRQTSGGRTRILTRLFIVFSL